MIRIKMGKEKCVDSLNFRPVQLLTDFGRCIDQDILIVYKNRGTRSVF